MDGGLAFLIFGVVTMVFGIGLFVFQEIRNYYERKGLLDRLMARDFPEYVTYDIERKKEPIKKNPSDYQEV